MRPRATSSAAATSRRSASASSRASRSSFPRPNCSIGLPGAPASGSPSAPPSPPTRSTADPRIRPAARRASTAGASSNGNTSVSGRIGMAAASSRNSVASRRVKLATERSTRSRQRSSYGNSGMRSRWIALIATVPPGATARRADTTTLPADPGGAECGGEVVLGRRAREDAHLAAPVAGHLDRQVGGGAEAEEPDPSARLDPAEPQRAVADDAGAEQGSGVEVGEAVGEREGEVPPGDDLLSVPAVDRPAPELGLFAQVLAPARAEAAPPAGAREPGQSHHLMAGNHRPLPHLDVAGHDLQVGAADAAGGHLDDHLAVAGDRLGQLADLEGVRGRGGHRAHGPGCRPG